MSYVVAAPEIVTSAATDLASISSALSAAHTAAATPTTGVVAAAEDEVSTAIAGLFSQHAQQYQALAGQAAAFHNQFTRNLLASANSYLSTEAANALSAATSGDIVESVGSALLSELVSNIPGVEETELIFDAAGSLIVTLPALEHSQTAFVNALQAGNLGAATAALVDAPPSVGSAFLYGQDTVAVPLSLPGVSVTLDVPVGGILAPLQPVSATVAITGNPPTTFPIPGTEVGGIVPALIGSLLGGGGLLGG
jgi:hypothetical protein